jgi:hypothetical protein
MVVLAIAALCLAGSIDASPTYAYDVPAASHTAIREFGAVGTATDLRSGADGSVSRPVAARGASTTPVIVSVATNTVDDALGLADDVATAVRPASTPWGRTVRDFQVNSDAWSRVSAHAEAASGRIYRGGTSIEEVFTSGDQWLVRHQVYDSTGDLLHETFRPYAKFGAG